MIELKNYSDLKTLNNSSINSFLLEHIRNKIYHLYINLSKNKDLVTFSFEDLGPILILENTDNISLNKNILSFTWNNNIFSYYPEWCHELTFDGNSFFNLCIIPSSHRIIDIYIDAKYLTPQLISDLKNSKR